MKNDRKVGVFVRVPILGIGMSVALWVLPWWLRRKLLGLFFHYKIDASARIGYSIVLPGELRMGSHSSIGHLNLIRRQDLVLMEEHAAIGHLNSIGGFGMSDSGSFESQERDPSLIVRRHASITSRHLIDCTDRVEVGEYALIAGYRSQFLTHAPDLSVPIQECAPIVIGRYVFVGTAAIVLKGVTVTDYCIISASSLVKRSLMESYWQYEGVPAVPVKKVDADLGFFTRLEGRIP